jgi:nitrite reductase (NADH) small subunit
MSHWIRIAAAADCPQGTAIETVVEDRVVALYHTNEGFFVLDGVCPHQGGPLGKGALTGCVVTCPWHGWQFDVRTGQHQFSPTTVQPRFDVRVTGGDVLIDVESNPL